MCFLFICHTLKGAGQLSYFFIGFIQLSFLFNVVGFKKSFGDILELNRLDIRIFVGWSVKGWGVVQRVLVTTLMSWVYINIWESHIFVHCHNLLFWYLNHINVNNLGCPTVLFYFIHDFIVIIGGSSLLLWIHKVWVFGQVLLDSNV